MDTDQLDYLATGNVVDHKKAMWMAVGMIAKERWTPSNELIYARWKELIGDNITVPTRLNVLTYLTKHKVSAEISNKRSQRHTRSLSVSKRPNREKKIDFLVSRARRMGFSQNSQEDVRQLMDQYPLFELELEFTPVNRKNVYTLEIVAKQRNELIANFIHFTPTDVSIRQGHLVRTPDIKIDRWGSPMQIVINRP